MPTVTPVGEPELDQDRVFESAAELFSILATPVRLKKRTRRHPVPGRVHPGGH